MNYTALNVKSDYSMLTSLIKIDDLVSFALKHKLNVLALCDNNLSYVAEFYNKCKKNNIKAVIGLEIKIDDYTINLYSKGKIGYHNLIKLNNITNITIDILNKYSKDIICIIPYESNNLYQELNKIYENTYQGYSNIEQRNNLVGNNLIYFNPVYYLEEKDSIYYPYVLALQTGKKIKEVSITSNNSYDNYLQEDITNNQHILSMCNFEMEKWDNTLPDFPTPDNISSYKYLRRLCKAGLKKKFGSTISKKYLDRLEYELSVIDKMGYSNYFLVVQDYVRYAKDNHILVGPGRGSAAGSLVAYLLDITSVDPIKYNLLFERFLNPERVSMPDIDIDFQDTRREEVVDYCIKKYGNQSVATIQTFGTMASKLAIRDVARCMDINLKIVDKLCSYLDDCFLKDNLNNQELKEYIRDNNLQNLYKVAMKLEGIKHHTSVHPAGIVISKYKLDDLVPLVPNHDNLYSIAFSHEYLEGIGLLKMDFLALRNLTLISNIIDNLHKNNINIEFDTIPDNDIETINLFKEANTLGIFQFESNGMISFLNKLKPKSFSDIASAIALYRPGPMQNIDTFIKRKNNIETINYYDESLKSILESTYGLMIYQEQVMQVSSIMAGYTLGEADVLRKAISKKKIDVLQEEEIKFKDRAKKRGYNDETINRVYQDILKFAGYGFNKAHAVVYSLVAYRMAYLKAHYKAYFMASLLTMTIGSTIKTKEYIYECKARKISILPPDINMSSKDYTVENGSIRYPLYNISNVGINTVNYIIGIRDKKFTDIYDFVRRIDPNIINSKIFESLIYAGVFNSFGINKKTLIDNMEILLNYASLIKDLNPDYVEVPVLEEKEEFDKKYLMQKELEVFGFYLSNHPVTELRNKYNNTITLKNLNGYFNRFVDTIVYVDRIRETVTKKQEKMAFVTGSDELSSIDVVFFPSVYQKDINVGDVLLLNGKVEKRYDKYQLVVSKYKII